MAIPALQRHPGIIDLVPDQAKTGRFVVKFGEGLRKQIIVPAAMLAMATTARMNGRQLPMQARRGLNLEGDILVAFQAEGILGGFKGAMAKAAFLLKLGVGLVVTRRLLVNRLLITGLRAEWAGAESQAARYPDTQAEGDQENGCEDQAGSGKEGMLPLNG